MVRACMIVVLSLSILGTLSDCSSESSSSWRDPHRPGMVNTEYGEQRMVYTEEREPCSEYNPLRNLYFGDLHAHTGLSHETWLLDVHATTADAYRFARGETILLPPLDEHGTGTRPARLERPLDFAAVTDHGEFLAEVEACVTPTSAAYDSLTCMIYRDKNTLSEILIAFPTFTRDPVRSPDICGPGRADCPALARAVWERIRNAAEANYDRTSECSFTTFVGYEHTGLPEASNYHRNVIFRNNHVPDLPTSYFEQPTPEGLWDELRTTCLEGIEGCDVLAVPHNSNESNGNKFFVRYPGAETPEEQRQAAAFRASMEPLVEIFQHKGDSECMNGLSGDTGPEDELCNFEKLYGPPFTDCGEDTGFGGVIGIGCISRLDYVRYALLEGLVEEERIGVNPYKLGIIASTDTHNAAPGMVAEDSYPGHWGIREDTPQERLGPKSITHQGIITNPGGLTAVWAFENSRDGIFDAFERRETYATSGPRIEVRFFGGWEYPDTMCADPDFVETGYQLGVPMGADLPPPPEESLSPRFAVSAVREQDLGGTAGTPLQRIQIVKGWIDSDYGPMLEVYEVAGDPYNGASVDIETCERTGDGFDRLCTVWTDPDFVPGERAFYYVRVVENPSCRWSTYECNRLPVGERPVGCSDSSIDKVIQERAWTSPIWYNPGPDYDCWDKDGDGYGVVSKPTCPYQGRDCNDGDPAIHPNHPETIGDGIDSDCDGDDNCGTMIFDERPSARLIIVNAALYAIPAALIWWVRKRTRRVRGSLGPERAPRA